LGENANCLLLCQSSDFLPLEDNCIDTVVTDPPYYDNVMYSKLSDFYYVWLRLALKGEYEYFRAEYTPKEKEVVVNSVRDRELSREERSNKFLKGLTGIFQESKRVLKKHGLLVFTFHHKESDAWSSVLQSVLNAGFYVVSTYPIHSEMSTSTHIYEKQNIYHRSWWH
jgi:adenine-specific DNA methylase